MTTKTKIFTRHLIRLLMAIAVSSTLLVVPSAANASANSIIDNPSRPTLIFVFQPFCYYCKRAAPFVAQLHAQLGADMDFIMVTDYADHTPFSNSFRSTFGLTMPLIEDRGLDFAKYKINGYPNFLWSVPGEGVTNWGPVGYDATAWARKDVPALLRLAKYGPPPARISTIKVGARPVVGQVDVSWSPVTAKTPISHYEVRARKSSSSAPQATSKSTILGTTGDQPNGIVMDAAGNIYTTNHGDFNATDQRSNNVSKITPAGVSGIFATTGKYPIGIVMDAAGNIYTANSSSDNVSKITPAGVSTILGTTGLGPTQIVMDAAGNIYTTNRGSDNVSKITPAGVSTIFATTGEFPYGIVMDAAGNIYTTNRYANNVSKITPAGVSRIFATTGAGPLGIVMDVAGNIYTANMDSNNVSKITPAGVSTILGTTGDYPSGIVMDAAGNIYTANSSSNNVSKITPAGVSTILGTTGDQPKRIVIDATGNIYTTNRGSDNVSKITPAGGSATNTTQSKDEEVFGVSGVSAAIGISNATLDITYLVAVRAISPAGTGAWSEETSVSWKTSSTTATVATVKTLSRGTSLTAESIASYAKLAIKAGSVASLKVSAKSSKYCIASFGATQLLGYQVGSCTVTVTLISKTGQSTSKTVTLEVTE